jgi:secondary thiamine-phosphate synthase enzyme
MIAIETTHKRQIIGLGIKFQTHVRPDTRVIIATVLHTTAALTTADLDPGTDLDFLAFLAAITPALKWRHAHDPEHAPDHLLASLIGCSIMIPVEKGTLQLGRWQRPVLVELDGPRERLIEIVCL